MPPPLPVGVQVEAAIPRESGTRKGKEKAQGGDDNDVKDASHRDKYDLSALYIVQQASLHYMLLEIHNAHC